MGKDFISEQFHIPYTLEVEVALEFGYQKHYGSQIQSEMTIVKVSNTNKALEEAMGLLRKTRGHYHYLKITAAYILD